LCFGAVTIGGVPAAADPVTQSCSARAESGCGAWVLADFDGDQKLDLAVADLPGEDSSGERQVTIQPDASTLPLHAGSLGELLRARDIDGDSDRDLVLYGAGAGPIAVWLNDGAGHFQRRELSEFRYQLSHDDPASLITAQIASLQSDPADHSRTDLGLLSGVSCPSLVASTPPGVRESLSASGFLSGTRARGPPSSL
jgi:hypothetical protein